jgi:hypothetical protein
MLGDSNLARDEGCAVAWQNIPLKIALSRRIVILRAIGIGVVTRCS